MTELDKLEQYLKEHDYIYSREDCINKYGASKDEVQFDWHQIKVFNNHRIIKWDAICHKGSLGYSDGLLEVMGDILDCNDVEGYLTAEQVIEMIERKDKCTTSNITQQTSEAK